MTPTYAVLFKCHFWDAFNQRQLERVKQRTGSGDVFVVVNETDGTVNGIDHPEDRIVRITENGARDIGLLHAGPWPMLWYSNDYHLHLFTRLWPDYQYYVMLEFDVVLNIDLDTLVERFQQRSGDFLGEPIIDDNWHWLFSCEGSYTRDQIRHWLICLTVFTNRAAHFLYDRRVVTGQRLRAGEIDFVPFSEAAIPTELDLAGFNLMRLSDFGSTSSYNWAPPFPETLLPKLEGETFIHPVLDEKRFVNNMMRAIHDPVKLLDEDDPLRQRFTANALEMALPQIHQRLWRWQNDKACQQVVELMQKSTDTGYLRLHGLAGDNLALGKPATQSSRSSYSIRPDEANGAVQGPVTGSFNFHTDLEERPWWMVDLQSREDIGIVRIFNRMDHPERADRLEVYVSPDGRLWELVGVHRSGEPFGGVNGSPLEVAVNRTARFVRLEIPYTSVLHLDQVQVLQPSSP